MIPPSDLPAEMSLRGLGSGICGAASCICSVGNWGSEFVPRWKGAGDRLNRRLSLALLAIYGKGRCAAIGSLGVDLLTIGKINWKQFSLIKGIFYSEEPIARGKEEQKKRRLLLVVLC
jgi:hypothetical protein